MNTANNQLRQDTDRRLREALLAFMEQGREPTVGELCEQAQINRSTFYRHYLDVYDLMEKTETQIQKGLAQVLVTDEPEQLEHLVRYVGEYRNFYRIYLKKNLDGSMEDGFQAIWETRLKQRFLAAGITDERRMLYYFHYVRAGMTTVLRLWLEDGCRETPEEIAHILRNSIVGGEQKNNVQRDLYHMSDVSSRSF